MKRECQKVSESLADYALDLLGESETADVRQHLADGCQSCEQELRELEAASQLLAYDLQGVAPPVKLKAKLMEAIAGESATQSKVLRPRTADLQSGRARWNWKVVLPYLAASVCAVALGWFVSQFAGNSRQARDTMIAQQQWQQQIDRARRDLGIPAAQPVDWRATDRGGDVTIMAFDDNIAEQLHLIVAGIDPPGGEVRYFVWLLDDGDNVLSAARLDVGSARVSVGVADWTNRSAKLHKAIVSAETAADPTSPSDQIIATAELSSD